MVRNVTFKGLLLSLLTIPLLAWADNLPQPVEIAALVTLTGNGADGGEWIRRGVELAKDDFNRLHPGAVSTSFNDTKNDPKEATNIYRQLSLRKRLTAVISHASGVGVALSAMTNSDGVVQVGVATASPRYRSVGDLTFRTYPSSDLEAPKFAEMVSKRFNGTLALLAIENEYGQGFAQRLKSELALRGLSLAVDESYVPTETDFRSLLTRIRGAKPDVILLSSYPVDAALILKQARELGITAQFVTGSAVAAGFEFMNRAGNAAEGLLLYNQLVDKTNSFYRRYVELYGDQETIGILFAARAYDALMVVAQSGLKCGFAGNRCIADQLLKLKDYSGASGKVTFDEAGDSVAMEFGVFKIVGNHLELLQ